MRKSSRRRRRKRYHWIGGPLTVLFVFLAILLLFTMFQQTNEQIALKEKNLSARNLGLVPKKMVEETTLAAIGDILIHDRLYNDAKTQNGYNFKPMFEYIRPILSKPDILMANQETLLGGEALGISSYPMFNSPVEIGDAIIDAGVDIVSTANNHSLDRREKGVLTSLSQLHAIGLTSVGTYASIEDQQTVTIKEANGIKFAFLSYTYGTNGMPIPEGKDYLVNLINRDAISAEVKRAKEQADLVVMSIHWGNEYQRFPTKEQEELAQFMVDQGINVIFGHHPHVLQPMEWLQAPDGSKALVVYSLGNFLSGQKWDYKDIGGMASLTIKKTVDVSGTTIELSNPQFFPTYVSSMNQHNYRVVPLQDGDKFGLTQSNRIYSEIINHMTSNLKNE